MNETKKKAAAPEPAPDQRPLTKLQAERLSAMSGISARELAGATVAQISEKYRWTIDWELLLFRRVCGKVVKRDPVTGELRKAEYGRWVFTAFKLLAKLRGLRGSALDVFGYTAERRMERRLIVEFEEVIQELLGKLNGNNHALAVKIASIPEEIRGFGHVKERHAKAAAKKQAELLEALRSPEKIKSAA